MNDTLVIVEILSSADVARAVNSARKLALGWGFSESDQFMIGTAVSELATNISRYATEGTIVLRIINDIERKGFEITAQDQGPGIEDLELAMQENYSSMNSLGLGFSSVKRIMDDFSIESTVGKGTLITTRKWR